MLDKDLITPERLKRFEWSEGEIIFMPNTPKTEKKMSFKDIVKKIVDKTK